MTLQKFRPIRSAALAATGLLMGGAFVHADDAAAQADQQQQQQQQQAEGESQAGSQDAPAGFVLIEEHVIVLTANEPQNHFFRAGEFWIEGNNEAAAAEVRIAANYLDMQASRAEGEGKQQLTQAAQDLRSAADQLQQGPQSQQAQAGQNQQDQQAQQDQQQQQQAAADQQAQQDQQARQDQQQQQPAENQQQGEQRQRLTRREQQMQRQLQQEARELTQAFAKANHALAQHFQSKAQAAIEKQNSFIAGHELQGAADALTAAFAWSGEQPTEEALRSIGQAQLLAMQLGAGADQAGEAQQAGARVGQDQQQDQGQQIPENAEQVLQELSRAIQSAGETIQGSSSDGQQQPGSDAQPNQ